MRISVGLAVFAVGISSSGSVHAHFKLQQPADWLQTDESGDPLGSDGTQKLNPCGEGTPSGLVTRVHAGTMLHVKLTETIPHGGHYRIALVRKYDPTTDDIPEPKVTLVAGSCSTAAIESPVVPPVLADNLFPHTQAQATANKIWETDVQVPSETGIATLQIIEFMTPHAPGCFYHHCAQLEIMPADADLGSDGSVVVGADGGAVTPDAGGGPTGSSGAGSGTSSGTRMRSTSANDDASGCSVGGGAVPSLLTGSIGLAAVVGMLRRRRRSALSSQAGSTRSTSRHRLSGISSLPRTDTCR